MKKKSGLEVALFLIRCSAVLACFFFVFNGHHPPAYGQAPQGGFQIQQMPILTVEDAVQDSNIKAINDHLTATDARADRQGANLSSLKSDVAGMQAEQRVAEFVIGLICSSGVILQLRKKAV